MAIDAAGVLKRTLYGGLFVAFLPAALVLWARATAGSVPLPAPRSPVPGLALALAGLALIAAGARALTSRGGGLPMNAFPPPRLVREGIYEVLADPMYVGFGLACFGVAIASGSASGFWLVSPAVALGAAALVYGYERHDLRSRFGDAAISPRRLSIPRGNGRAPTPWQRAAVYVWILLPWLLAYSAVQALGVPRDAFSTLLPFEHRWPVIEWTELFYVSVYIFVPLTPLLILARSDLRRFAIMGGLATVVVTLLWVTIPAVAVHRPFESTNALGRLLELERATSRGVAAFPAFHVLWALIAADAWGRNALRSGHRSWRFAGWGWAALITVSCLTTGMHAILDIAAAGLLWLPLRRYDAVWTHLRNSTEAVANSWREWRVGPVRWMNHGMYAAVGAGAGVSIAGIAAGPERLPGVLLVALAVLLGAGLWAQALEGSSRLLRPFGWYGGLAGGLVGVLAAGLLGAPVLRLTGAFAIAAPWVQAIGRLRCLVQGCCHGGPAPGSVGIRYRHRRSRVTQLAGLADTPVHPTPLYSIAANLPTGLLLLRLWSLGASPAIVTGAFLILNGVARFVEEAYRAEPQTPIVAGLRLYQWIAIGSVIAGAAVSALPATPPPTPFAWPGWPLAGGALGIALVAGLAMGLDFPRSNRRFARLAAAS